MGLAGVTWGVTALWDRFMEVRAQKGVDKLFDAIDYVLRPCVRLGRRGCSFVWRRLPPSLREPEGQWRALLLASWLSMALSLLLQHWHTAHAAPIAAATRFIAVTSAFDWILARLGA